MGNGEEGGKGMGMREGERRGMISGGVCVMVSGGIDATAWRQCTRKKWGLPYHTHCL